MDIKVPALAEGVEEAVITLWLTGEGQTVQEGDDIVEMSTDKATFNMPSPAGGILSRIIVSEGETVRVGQVIAELETL